MGVSGTGTRGEAAHWSILMDMVSYRRPAMDGVVGVSGTGTRGEAAHWSMLCIPVSHPQSGEVIRLPVLLGYYWVLLYLIFQG